MSKQKQADIIRELLKADVQLCSLSDIGTHRTYDFSMPTLTQRRRFTSRHTFASDESFMEMFQQLHQGTPYGILSKAGAFSEDNSIVLFGGCLLDLILKRPNEIKDFDLRLVGGEYINNEEKCVFKAKEFVSSVFAYMLEENKGIDRQIEQSKAAQDSSIRGSVQKFNISEVTVSRRKSTVTIHIPGRTGHNHEMQPSMCFQLTFAPTRSVEAMLGACQPHATRVAIYNNSVVLDQMARYCIESTCVVLHAPDFKNYFVEAEAVTDPQWSARTVPIQLQRYIKYFHDKGMDIILPDLDISKVPRRNLEYSVPEVLALPQLVVVFNAVEGNKIIVDRLSIAKKYEVISPTVGEYDENPEYDVGEAIHHNIRCLVSGVLEQFKHVSKGEVWTEVFDFVPTLTPRMVEKSYETVTESLMSGSIVLNKVTGYFSETPPHEVLEKLVIAPLQSDSQKHRPGLLPAPFELEKKMLEEIVEKEKARLLKKIEGLRDEIVSKSCDRLVVPFPQDVSTDKDLYEAVYGDYYKNGA